MIEAMIGEGNTHVTELKHLENNRFETAKLYGRRLCLITDAEKYSGDVSVLKAVTGGDSLRFEEKYKQSGETFRFNGIVLVSANQDIASSDYTSGLERRRITIRFDHVVDPKDRRDLDAEFAPLIPGILNWALGMPDKEMRRLIVETNRYITGASKARIQRLITINPVAAWLDDRVAYHKVAKTGVGVNRKDEFGKIENTDRWLYANYCDWCAVSGYRQQAINTFVPIVKDLLTHQLRLEGVEHQAEKTGKYFYGIRIRGEEESRDLSPLRQGIYEIQDDEPVTDGDESVTDPVTNKNRMVTKVTSFSIKNTITTAHTQPGNSSVGKEGGNFERNIKSILVLPKVRNVSNGAALARNQSVTSPSPSSPGNESPSPVLQQLAEMLPDLSGEELDDVLARLNAEDLAELQAGEVSVETLRCVAESVLRERGQT